MNAVVGGDREWLRVGMSQDVFAYGVTREEEQEGSLECERALRPTNTNALRITASPAPEGVLVRRSIAWSKDQANCTLVSRYGLVAKDRWREDGIVSSQSA